MKHLTIGEYAITMNNRDHAQLVKRFDVSKAKLSENGWFYIRASCICQCHPICSKCPFGMKCLEIAYSLLGQQDRGSRGYVINLSHYTKILWQ